MKTPEKINQKIVVFIVMSFLMQSSFCLAQSKRIGQSIINPTMKVSNLNSNEDNPMRLDELKIDIKVVGQIAVTTLDMTYFNSNSRTMEGEFNFPLAEGQTISRFSLDINGSMREGVVVEKEQGRRTFEAIARRKVDPGLLEMTAGNNFRARVSPLPANGSRRIILSFEQELTDKGKYDLFLLPLQINESVKKFTLHAEVLKNQVNIDTENNELSTLTFNKWNDSYVSNLVLENFKPDKQIALMLPHQIDSFQVFTATKNNNSDSSYFYITLRPKLFEEVKELPKRITLLWDNSNSSHDRNIEKELTILDGYIKKIGSLSIELVPFNIEVGKATTFDVIKGNWDNLKSALNAIVYDGGTSFGCIDFSKFTSNEILLFSDGISNFSNSEPTFSSIPVITVNSSNSADHSFLSYIAQRSGGVYLNLGKLSSNEAIALLCNNNYHFISAQIKNGNISNVYPSMPCQFTNTLSLVGVLDGKTASILLNFGFGTTIIYSKQVVISAGNLEEPDMLRRIWAEKKITELNFNAEKNKDEITRTGKEFGIVTQNTSLIVLENLNDYLQYQIEPPKEMQEEYYKLKFANEKEVNNNMQSHFENIVKLFEEQSKWWNTNYPLLPEKPVSMNKSRNQSVRYVAPVVVDSVREEVQMTIVSEVALNESEEVEMVIVSDAVSSDNVSEERIEIQKTEVKSDIQLNAWDPQTPYLKVLQYSTRGDEYKTYLKLKTEYGSTPAFYIDATDFFSKLGEKDTALRILSNLAELKLESPQLLRILGKKLLILNRNAEAVQVFEKVLKIKGEEPQSYRDLGLAYEANGNSQLAIDTLYEIVKRKWDSRFPGIEIIVLNEINNIIATHQKLDYSFIDKRLLKKEPVDIRVVLSWDTDNCDMDLWVTDPKGEKCYYSNKLTRLGGKISNDFTQGYGPEEFMIKKAVNGEYFVQSNYYGTSSQSLLAPVNLSLMFITNYGKPNQKKKEVNIRLENQKDVIDVGKFNFTTN